MKVKQENRVFRITIRVKGLGASNDLVESLVERGVTHFAVREITDDGIRRIYCSNCGTKIALVKGIKKCPKCHETILGRALPA